MHASEGEGKSGSNSMSLLKSRLRSCGVSTKYSGVKSIVFFCCIHVAFFFEICSKFLKLISRHSFLGKDFEVALNSSINFSVHDDRDRVALFVESDIDFVW